MKRSRVTLGDVAEFGNLTQAFWRAAKGKRNRPDVQAFGANLNAEVAALGDDIRAGTVSVGRFRQFRIFDPKPRVIHAPVFRERVLHHALMAKVGPVLDRALIDDTYACRVGKGTLAAVHRAQHHARRHPFFVKIDVKAYFDSIGHQKLLSLLKQRFRDLGLLELCVRMIRAYSVKAGRGLPIGALTSQHFANAYLGSLDRFLLERMKVRGYVRYLDDAVWWCESRAAAKASLAAVRAFVPETLGLTLHDDAYVQGSTRGLSFLGFRVYPGRLHLSKRRRARFRAARRAWETAHTLRLIDAEQLQRGMDSALAIVQHADARSFLREEWLRRPPVEA